MGKCLLNLKRAEFVWTWRKKNIKITVQFSEIEVGRSIRNFKAAFCCFIATLSKKYSCSFCPFEPELKLKLYFSHISKYFARGISASDLREPVLSEPASLLVCDRYASDTQVPSTRINHLPFGEKCATYAFSTSDSHHTN